MIQHNLEYTPAQKHSATSRDAAKSVRGIAKTQEDHALELFIAHGGVGMTDDELHAAMVELEYVPEYTRDSSTRRARVGLLNKGLIEDSKKTRPGRSGRGMTVWCACG